MQGTSSIGSLATNWEIGSWLVAQVSVPDPAFKSDIRIDSAGIITLMVTGISEDLDDILSGQDTLLRYKASPQDFISYREYSAKRGV